MRILQIIVLAFISQCIISAGAAQQDNAPPKDSPDALGVWQMDEIVEGELKRKPVQAIDDQDSAAPGRDAYLILGEPDDLDNARGTHPSVTSGGGGRFGEALVFDGENDYAFVFAGWQGERQTYSQFAVDCWIWPEDTHKLQLVAMANGVWTLAIARKVLKFQIWTESGSVFNEDGLSMPLTETGKWYHLRAGVDADSMAFLELDGRRVAHPFEGGLRARNSSIEFGTKRRTDRYFKGRLDALKITTNFKAAGLVSASPRGTVVPIGTELTEESLGQLRKEIERRQSAFFTQDGGKPLVRRPIKKDWNNRGDFTRHYNQSIVLFAARALKLNEQIEEANAALREMCEYHLERPKTFFEVHSFPGTFAELVGFYICYGPNGTSAPNRLSVETSAMLEKTFWEWANEKSKMVDTEWEESKTWHISDSENHHALHVTSCWSAALALRDAPAYRDKPFKDGHTPVQHLAAWTAYLKEYLRQRARKGTFVEIDSPSYATATIRCIYLMHDYSHDPDLKSLADKMLTLYWVLWAEEQFNGIAGGAQTRTYMGHALRGTTSLAAAAWYVMGMGNESNLVPHAGMIPFVNSSWQPSDMVLRIAYGWQTRAAYEIRERRMGLAVEGYDRPTDYKLRTDDGGILRYTWCTPDFIMGSLITEARPVSDWAAISSQNRWSGVIFPDAPGARVFAAPYSTTGESILNGFWSVQSKGAMISQKLPGRDAGSTIAGEGKADDWRVFFSNAALSTPVRNGRWTFTEAKDAYVAVCVVAGAATLEDDQWGRWLVCEDLNTPVVIDVVSKAGYETFDAFQKAAMAQSLTFENQMLHYESLNGDRLSFPADRSGLPEINGASVNPAREFVYDTPFVQSKWDSGVVTIRYGDEERILNFME